MDKLASLDWTLIQSFLAVAETGSLSGGARRLGSSQPTLGRQIRTLETLLEVELFQRHPRGLDLTALGLEILPAAQNMFHAMNALTLSAAGAQTALNGDVRITCSIFIAHHVLPDILADIRRLEPAIRIDLVASDDSDNLLFREADIAVRMYRPKQLDMVTRHLGDIPLGLFASRDYADRKGLPATPDDLQRHDLVGYDQSELMTRAMQDAGWPVTRDWFNTRCDNQSAYWQLVRAGCGIGFCQKHVGDSDPDIVAVLSALDIPPLPVWLTAHEIMRHTPRISRIWDLLSAGLRPFVS